jgi:DNA-binding MarR family transcriptional regulator
MVQVEEQIVRKILMAIDDDSGVSQRKLSNDVGIAVGSVNWYLKRCVSKGLVKLQQAPVKRYLYYLTPRGFDEKARLTASFLKSSFELYRKGRVECFEFFQTLSASNSPNVFLAGDGDFAEIAVLSGIDAKVSVLAVIDADAERSSCAGIPVVRSLREAMKASNGVRPDTIVVTHLSEPKRAYNAIKKEALMLGLPDNLIHVPRILNFRPG